MIFQRLPVGQIAPHTEAVKEENISKNRYKNIYACRYDILINMNDYTNDSDGILIEILPPDIST